MSKIFQFFFQNIRSSFHDISFTYLKTTGLQYPRPFTIVSLMSELSHLMSGTRRWNRLDAVQAWTVGDLSDVDSGEDAML